MIAEIIGVVIVVAAIVAWFFVKGNKNTSSTGNTGGVVDPQKDLNSFLNEVRNKKP